ncbi:DEKNAAC103128 [Brettanomyces naardenensis]|uniref:DEKNAAC103128 n=1 Tax=Brettanomyces naardenensis TaxID=13370 RepID=A0A448YMR1_BRENA|nr:DEKNAAC103128 [Brettanomyces naardenensis]
MIFSTNADLGFEASKNDPKGFKPFASHREILDYIQKYAKANDLEKYIRFNTSVQKVVKKAGKWQVTVDQIDREKGEERWYTEEFDAVFVASGRGSIPYVPEVEGLKGFASRNPDVILHAKAFRNTDDFKGKKVLVVGSGISALDISQYLIAAADRTIMSFDSADTVVPHQVYQWTHDILSDNSIPFDRYPKIKRYLDDDGVEFVDGKIERGFDKIILATGYHLYQPFLDFPGNKPVTTNTRPNGPLKRLQNLYLYSFTVGDPTLAYTSISNNPYFFPLGESIATMVSGVWSGHSKLPAVEVQQEWADKNLPDRKEQEALFKEDHFLQVVGEMFKLAPEGRTSVTDRIKKGENEETKEVMKELFYKFSKGELREEA